MGANDMHTISQQESWDHRYSSDRDYWFSSDPMTRYVTYWRLLEAFRRLRDHAGTRFTNESRVLFLCAGDGAEASICCDHAGLENVSFSDISPVAIRAGVARDPRLQGICANAEDTGIPDSSFDVVVVQDGLHHLRSPVRGYTEMLRIAKLGVIFIEPSGTLVGRLIGTTWEVNGEAVNYVFRWTRRFVQQVTSSYLGKNSFDSYSYISWHHNVVLARIGAMVGAGKSGLSLVRLIKRTLEVLLPGMGNTFTALILKR